MKEDEVDIFPVARWFGEETFTYIRGFWSIGSPHVLPYYVPDKLMGREIAYQKTGEGRLSRGLKEQKKAIWLTFPLQCGSFALHDYGHALKEVEIIKYLKLDTVPGRQYDANGIVKDFTSMVKVKQFTHEEETFDDLFLQVETFSQVFHMASLLLTSVDVEAFHVYRKKRLLKVPLDLLQIEPIRELTPSVSLEGSSKENLKKKLKRDLRMSQSTQSGSLKMGEVTPLKNLKNT